MKTIHNCPLCKGNYIITFTDGHKICADCGNLWDEPRIPNLAELLDKN